MASVSRLELCDRMRRLAADKSGDLAIADTDAELDFAGVMTAAERWCSILTAAAATERSPVVAVALPGGGGVTSLEFATWLCGGVVAALPPAVTEREAEGYLSALAPDVFVRDGSAAPAWDQAMPGHCSILDASGVVVREPVGPVASSPVDLGCSDPIQIQFTSGSTGVPKALVFDAASLLAGLDACRDWAGSLPDGPSFLPMPQHQAMGRAAVLEQVVAGHGVVVGHASSWAQHRILLERHACRTVLGNPTYARLALQLGLLADLHIEYAVLGTAAVEPELVEAVLAGTEARRVEVRYGVSECFGALTRLIVDAASAPHEVGCVGSPLAGVSLAVGDDGALKARAPATADSILTAVGSEPVGDENGFVCSGDLAACREGGLWFVRGRASALIKRRGYRIAPQEIESVICADPGVAECVAVGLADPLAGQRIVAAIETQPGTFVDTASVVDRCRQFLSVHKIPDDVVVLDCIPRLPSGKPDRTRTTSVVATRQENGDTR